jgi:hypothetical protein
MNFKTLKLYYKLCRKHYMFRPIWPSSGVKSYIKIVLKTAALFHLCFPASHWYVRCFILLFLSFLRRVPLIYFIGAHVLVQGLDPPYRPNRGRRAQDSRLNVR